ncbi:MAG: alpha/beta hydrolase [Dichotomicrobium sp.]
MITDWDDAYDNRGYIENADSYPARWAALAQAFRDERAAQGRCELGLAYGSGDRERLDLFHPHDTPRGLVVFAHGGYWKAFDKSYWSHLAQGPLAHGWAVCIPSYMLAPEARISQITRQFAQAVSFAGSRIEGQLRLVGHSAGGHLVSRMISSTTPLPPETLRRIGRVISISGLHDMRPLLRTAMNGVLRLDEAEAAAESAALLEPISDASVLCWVGADERPEFLRQNDLLANIWTGLGAEIRSVHAPGRHHFSVIEDLADASSELCNALVG